MGAKLQDFLNILKQIDKIDIYGQQISLKFKKQSEFKTRFGGLITLIVGLLTGMWTIVTIYQLVNSTVVSIIPQQILINSNETREISLSPYLQDAFQIGIFDQQTLSPIEKSYFDLIYYYYEECDVVQTKVEVKSAINQKNYLFYLKECDSLYQSYEEYNLLKNNKNGYFCFDKEQLFNTKDDYPSISQTKNCRNNIYLLVVRKQNLSNQQRSQLNENSLISLSIPTNLIDYTDVSSPFQRISLMKQYEIQKYYNPDNAAYPQKGMVSVDFDTIHIDNQRNLSLQESSSTQSFVIEQIVVQGIKNVINVEEYGFLEDKVNEDDIIFKIKLGFTEKNSYTKYNRYFQSIPTILGILGGGIKIVVLMGFLIVSPLCKIHFQKTILNEVFNFENDLNEQQGQDNQDQGKIQEKQIPQFKFQYNQPTLKSLEGQQSVIKGNNSMLHNSQLINSESNNLVQVSNQKIGNPKTQMKILNLDNQQFYLSQQINPNSINKLPLGQSVISPANTFNLKQELQPSSMTNINNNKLFQNIEREKSPLSAKHDRSPHKSRSIISQQNQQKNITNLENNEDPNIMNQSVQKGSKKNKLIEIIKETILINSQKQLAESQNFFEQNSPALKLNKRSSFQSNQQLQCQKQQNKKKQKDLKKAEDQIFEKHFKTTFNPLKISFLQSFFYYIWPFGKFKRTKEQISYSVEKLNYHLDSIYIIKKLLEIDKLKMLLLDENQIKLLEFLPKPTINLNKIQREKDDESQNASFQSQDGQQKINILYQDTRNDLTKATQAFQAFQEIKVKKNLTQIDRKLMNLLDPKIAEYFNLNVEDIVPKSQKTLQTNQNSIENEIQRQQNQNYGKDPTQRLHYQNGILENSVTYSQNIVKDKYPTNSIGSNSPYITSPLEIYRRGTKKASMFKKQPIKQIQRCSISVTQQSQKYDEIEEDNQNNSLNNSKLEQQNEQYTNKLTRIRSISNDSPQNINKRINQDNYLQKKRSKNNSQSQRIRKSNNSGSIQNKKMDQISRVVDKIDSNRNRVESVYDHGEIRISQIMQDIKDKTKDNRHNALPIDCNESVNSIFSDMSQNKIADESIQLQSFDHRKLKQFTTQNKFSASLTPNNKQAIQQKANQSQRNFSTAIISLISRKPSIEEENKLISQKEIVINQKQ